MRIGHLVDLEVVVHELDSVLQAIPECRVATPIDELVVIHEEPLRATDTVVAADIVRPPVLTRECSLHSVPELGQVELVWRQSVPHLPQVVIPIVLHPLLVVFI